MNDDTISRKSVIDAVHTATYGFICGAEDGDEMTEADKLVLSINKAVCGAIKELPSVQSTMGQLTADDQSTKTDVISRRAAIDAVGDVHPLDYNAMAVVERLRNLPSVQPEKICVATVTLSDEQIREAVDRAKNEVISVLQPERKKGRWIGGELGRCSICGHEGNASDIWNGCKGMFCPNCGADMRGATNEV